ncbi:MAG: leucyl aminopeptidase, partial [Lachnospiraceae bacterium]|nr:leucyl aminopeptidase [Lachnospiraceae bacterium]
MRYQEELQAENAKVQERYALAMERIAQIALEQDNIALPYRSYFQKTAAFLLLLKKLQESFTKGEAKEWDLDKWKAVNQDLYAD